MADVKSLQEQLTPAERAAKLKLIGEGIRALLVRVVTTISGMIKDLRENNPPLTKVSTAMIDAAIDHIKTCNIEEMVASLKTEHARWDRALDRNRKFFTQDIVVVLKKIPNASALKEPLVIYQTQEDEGFKNFPGGKSKFPIGDIDFDRMFALALFIIQGVCSYNKTVAVPDPTITAYNVRVYQLATEEKLRAAAEQKVTDAKKAALKAKKAEQAALKAKK